MTPVERAKAVYDREPCARSFAEDLEAHLLHGYVLSTPETFVMARPVCSRDPVEMIVDPWVTYDRKDCDAWLIYLFAGDLRPALSWFPYPLPLIGWERKNALRFHGFESALARIGSGV